ncbi:nitrogen regulatory protein P-II family [Pilibacter termitis]|uniref:Nitrogen regulatory protein P-II family n=1 Tax=Pilibacter termitis TaxID=263852 RepID=A0A1T4PNP9_9ENTE|nr:P-II family nitrogen regulator [Pilibacter termitis]SJZ92528.1 nitrogen regulatory protein P-II family [Pilibacter termitis]
MKKIQAIVRAEKLEDLKKKIGENELANGMTVSQVLGFGQQKGFDEYIRGQKILTTLLAKVQIEIVVPDEKVEDLVKVIVEEAQTGEVGDGKIFIIPIEDAIRIRTGERGEKVL